MPRFDLPPPSRPFPTRGALRILALALALGAAPASHAAPSGAPPKEFDLAAGRAPATLNQFAAQAGAEQRLLYSVDAVEGVPTRAVRGEFTAREALELMLVGSPLRVVEDATSGALAVERASPPPGPAPPSSRPPPRPAPLPIVAGASRVNDEIVRLTPFEVQTDKANSYGALESNALSAFSMDLRKMPATAQVFTQAFIKDTGALTIEDLLINYSAVVGYNPADTGAYTSSPGDRDGNTGLSIRGFGGSNIRFDGFFGPSTGIRSASGGTPTFAIERVEVVEGPQSLLYGAVGGGGVLNAVSKRALFGVQSGSLAQGVSALGSKYATLDYNVGGDRVALRIAATQQDNATVRQNLGNTTAGIYAQLALQLGPATVVRVLHGKYETVSTNGFNPSLKPFLSATDPRANNTAQWFAATNQVPAGIFGGAVDWNNVDSFAGWWGDEPITNAYNTLIVESRPLPWLAAKLDAVYNEMTDWRNTTGLSLLPVGAGNPYGVPAIQLGSPNLNFQSQRQRGVQLNLVASNELFHGAARSQTVLGGYWNHVGPSFGSSGITYAYVQADQDWNPVLTGNPAQDYGRVLMPNQFIPVAGGQILKYGLFRPGAARVTVGGTRYILVPRILQAAAAKGSPLPGVPSNPYGLVPNGGVSGFTGFFNPGTEEHEQYLDLGNYTDWLDGRLQTLVGVSFDRAISQNTGATNVAIIPWKTYPGYEVGVIWQALPWLGIYANLGTAATPAGSTHDLYGNALAAPDARSPVPEFGLKAHSPDGRFDAQLAWDVATRDRNEIQSVDGSYQNAVNPSGINGRFGGAGTNNFVNVDRTATSLEFLATADPVREWRLRFSVSYLFSRIANSVSYAQLYNDQFRTNAAGQVTYQNGTVVFVNGAAADSTTAVLSASGAPGAAPLTLAMINDPASPYYAQPNPTSGSISNPALKTILTGGAAGSLGAAQLAANGPIATGATGLPLSQAQYTFVSPFPGNAVQVFAPGNLTTGYPGWQWNVSSDYTLSRGPLRGLGVYFDAVAQYSTRAFYAFYPGSGVEGTQQVNESRVLYVLPTIARCDLALHYAVKLRRATWTTRVSVGNVFNHDRFYFLPQVTNGTFLQATQRTPPRLWSWSNEIDF